MNGFAQGLRLAAAALAALALMGGGIDPFATIGAPAGEMTVPAAEPAPPAAADQAAKQDEKEPVPPPVAKAKAAAKGEAAETLPWASAKAVAKTPPVKKTAATPDGAKCRTLGEAPCRKAASCAWLADIPLDDGSVAAAHCVARGAPKKKAEATPVDGPTAGTPAMVLNPMPGPAAPEPDSGTTITVVPGKSAPPTAPPPAPEAKSAPAGEPPTP